jgi:predicted TIM-barrel fold metal-dependent hydrolase
VIVDAHVHVACSDTERYPRLAQCFGTGWWAEDSDPDSLKAVLDANGVTRAVVVHAAGVYGYDCRCTIDAVGGDPTRFALVAGVDMAGADPGGDVEQLADNGATGVRLSGFGRESADWVTDGRGAEVWAAAAEAGVVVVPTLPAEHLAGIADLVTRCPSVPVVVDHCGFLHLGGRDAEESLFRLGDLASVHVKVSTHNLTLDDAPKLVERLATRFGAERLCWGSDYPQLRPMMPYPEMLRLARRATQDLDPGDRQAFFATTSLRLWWPNLQPEDEG